MQLSDFIKNIFICVPKMNKSLTGSNMRVSFHFWVNYPFNFVTHLYIYNVFCLVTNFSNFLKTRFIEKVQ